MTASQYFYDDPLAAAWMAKHFGMQFSRGDQCIIGWGDFTYSPPNTWDAPFVIHPDSVSLLEPQVGDLVEMTYSRGEWINYRHVTSVEEGYYEIADFPDKYGFPDYIGKDGERKIFRIVERNSIPFHWPQSEQPQVSA